MGDRQVGINGQRRFILGAGIAELAIAMVGMAQVHQRPQLDHRQHRLGDRPAIVRLGQRPILLAGVGHPDVVVQLVAQLGVVVPLSLTQPLFE